jgi:hypothetical protein
MERRWCRRPDGQVVQVPVREDGQPEHVVGVPVPVLDETTERFWWDTGNYFFVPAANPPKRDQRWYYAYGRTLPGYPTFTGDHDGPGVRRRAAA